jgi:glutamate/tyrosine decarboxylase-like PLP-dependent enzyme
MLGTRSGAPIAAAWAALRSIAREGYLKMADSVMNTTHEIQKGIESIPGLKVISKPVMSVFSFTSDRHDIYLIGDELSKRGWNLDKLQFPSALHMTVSYDNTGHSGEFLEALKESVSVVEGQKIRAASSHVLASVVRAMSRFLPEKWFRRLSARFTGILNTGNSGGATTGAAAYGMMVAIDNRENVNEIMLDVLDKLYSV